MLNTINLNKKINHSTIYLPFVIIIANGTAPAAHGVNIKVIEWFSASHALVLSTNTIPLEDFNS